MSKRILDGASFVPTRGEARRWDGQDVGSVLASLPISETKSRDYW